MELKKDKISKKFYFRYVASESGLKLHEEPSSDAPVIMLLPNRSQVFLFEKDARRLFAGEKLDTWEKVQYNNLIGWVTTDFLSYEAPAILCSSLNQFPIHIGAGVMVNPDNFTLNEKGEGEYYNGVSRLNFTIPISWAYKKGQIEIKGERIINKISERNKVCMGEPCYQEFEKKWQAQHGDVKSYKEEKYKWNIKLVKEGEVEVSGSTNGRLPCKVQ